MFFWNMWYFSFFGFFMFIANIAKDFHCFSLFEFYWKCYNIILSCFLHSSFVFTCDWIVSLYYINICCIIFISNNLSNFFWNMFNFKTIKVCYIFSNNAIWWVPIDSYSSAFIIYSPYFILGKLLFE